LQLEYQNILNLTEYTKLVLAEIWKFPDFSDKCPICGAKNCAVRIGFYWRWVYIFKLKIKLYIPVARYLCRRKNKVKYKWKSTHRTFSLLPSQIIPYKLYDTDSLMFMAEMRFKKGMKLLDIATEFSALSDKASVSPATVFKYLLMFLISHNKMITLLKLEHDSYGEWADQIINYTGGSAAYVEHIYKKYACFLFGTPSQLRYAVFSGKNNCR